MFEPGVYHVIRRGEDCWQVIKEGFKRPHVVGRSKEEAIVLAKRLAKVAPAARVVVHGESEATIEERYDSQAA